MNQNSLIKSNLQSILTNLIKNTDWVLVIVTLGLIYIGLTTLSLSQIAKTYAQKQEQFMWVGLVLLIMARLMPYKVLLKLPVIISLYTINLILLITVMVKGHSAMGAQRWLSLGPITIQPSELAKIVVIFTLALYLGRYRIHSFFDIIKTGLIILPPAILVFKQPDLGTSLTFGAVFIGMIYYAGATITDIGVIISPVLSLIFNAVDIQYWHYYLIGLMLILAIFWRRKFWDFKLRAVLIILVLITNIGFGYARPHLWGLLKEYQQKRLTSFINPYTDPKGSGYHILQSLIAIGSGGFMGSGLGKGNQSQGAFIPERHTDFIYAVISEELGFKISALIIILYTVLCLRALKIANLAKNEPTGSILSIGIMCMFLFHVFLNIGMTIGIMPVAGVPLPFLSYGGTALLVDLFSIGVLESIRSDNPPENLQIQ